MKRRKIERSPVDRRGVVLILALGMLVLFTIVAITLAAISKTAMTSAANFKRLEQFGSLRLDVAPEEVEGLFRFAMNQLIYDTRNKQSAIRGHSLLRDMYGGPARIRTTGQGVEVVGGAELRGSSLAALLDSSAGSRPKYEGVFNGTGIFLPRKIRLVGAPPIEMLSLSPAEVAVQTAYLHVPLTLGPELATKIGSDDDAWRLLFRSTVPNPLTVPDARLWLPRFPLNYQVVDAYSANAALARLGLKRLETPRYPGGGEIEPELFYSLESSGAPQPHWFGFDEDYDYPDVNNMFLAMERADGKILIPSFHRPKLIAEVVQGMLDLTGLPTGELSPAQIAYLPEWFVESLLPGNLATELRLGGLRGLVLRPRPVDYDAALLGVESPRAGRFPSLPGSVDFNLPTGWPDGKQRPIPMPQDLDLSGGIGDSPMELDVDTDGDGLRDAIWVDLGHPVITVGDVSFKPLFAFKVVDMDSRINLNVHGNLYRTPQSSGAVGYPLMHSSNYGASPAEVNPQHGLILGDGGGKPEWATVDAPPAFGINVETNAYRRLKTGDDRSSPPTPGVWSPPAESTVAGARRSAPGVAADASDPYAGDDNANSPSNPANPSGWSPYSEGSGLDAAAGGQPATQGPYSSRDAYGLGRRIEPFSKASQLIGTATGLYGDEGNVVGSHINHAASSSGYGGTVDALETGTAATTVRSGGVSIENLTIDEPQEVNVYGRGGSRQDSLITASQMAGVFAGEDIDSSLVDARLGILSPEQFHQDVAATPGAFDFTRQLYAKKRMRRMFTHASWDLNHFNAPPNWSHALDFVVPIFPPAVPSDFAALPRFADSDLGIQIPQELASLFRQHNGFFGVNQVLRELAKRVGPGDQAFLSLATHPAHEGDPLWGKLIPREVLEGRRFDLNRPLTRYTETNGAQVDLEREAFARQIYVLLSLSCGAAADSLNPLEKAIAKSKARVLAQLAVNIVDFIDPDSVMTRMRYDWNLLDGWQDPGASQQDLAEYTVFGFELPELVINEALAVVVEEMGDPNGMPPQPRREHTHLWTELFNPWPNYVDPSDNERGVRLFNATHNASVYLLQVKDNRTATGAQGRSQWLAPDWAVIQGLPAGDNPFVTFAGGDDNALYVQADPPGFRVYSRGQTDPLDGRDKQGTFLVGPPPHTENDVELLPADAWTPPSGNDESTGDNDYTAAAFRYTTELENYNDVEFEIKLYRLRNPMAPPNNNPDVPEYNPYVVMDYVKLQYVRKDRRPYFDKEGQPQQPIEAGGGCYFVIDEGSPTLVPDPAGNSSNQRFSLQRRQPWHGYNSEWTPYGQNHPLTVPTNVLPLGSGSVVYLEGVFLGLPSLARAGAWGSGDDSVNDLKNAMQTNGFSLGDGSPPVSFRKGLGGGQPLRENPKALRTYVTFPFANRQLHSPMELLSVRMYGSHTWSLNPGATGTGPGDVEWRLRFTDDYEFVEEAFRQSDGSGSGVPTKGFYSRIWRSRQAPWFLSNRYGHPTWKMPGLPPNWSNPLDALLAIIGESGTEFQLPLPHLYRFFEFVECRSAMHENGAAADYFESDPPPGDPIDRMTTRESRVPGKMNLNLITEEEQFKALVDSVSAMWAWPMDVEGAMTMYQSGNLPPNAPAPNTVGMWPSFYFETLTSPLGEASTGVALDYQSRLVPWSSLAFSASGFHRMLGEGPNDRDADFVPFGGGEMLAMRAFRLDIPQATAPYYSSDESAWAQTFTDAAASFSAVPSGNPDLQWPGLLRGLNHWGANRRPQPTEITSANPPANVADLPYPGVDPNVQVTSEFFRQFLLSRAGADGIAGTGDDRPFRSYAADNVNETILRQRNFSLLHLPHGGCLGKEPPALPIGSENTIAALEADGSNDTSLQFGLGSYLLRMGGQWTPRLFDPVPNPYSASRFLSNRFVDEPIQRRRILFRAAAKESLDPTSPQPDAPPLDYWMLENRRNEVLVKIANNTTTRSHVFAVWVTVGMFRVEPGTEHLKVPLLGEEVGSDVGRPVRHRAFFIVDRSKATKYDYEDIDANYELPQIDLIEYYKIME